MKRLYKSRKNKVIDGVCAGIAEYLDVDPVLIRVIFIILLFVGGIGFLLYLAGMLIIPPAPEGEEERERKDSRTGVLFVLGLILVLIGFGLLLQNFGIFSFWSALYFVVNFLVPAIFIIGGILLILAYIRNKPRAESSSSVSTEERQEGKGMKKLFRSKSNRMLFGVCGGLGEYLNTDPTVIRILWVILAFSSLGFALLLYLIMALLIPDEPPQPS